MLGSYSLIVLKPPGQPPPPPRPQQERSVTMTPLASEVEDRQDHNQLVGCAGLSGAASSWGPVGYAGSLPPAVGSMQGAPSAVGALRRHAEEGSIHEQIASSAVRLCAATAYKASQTVVPHCQVRVVRIFTCLLLLPFHLLLDPFREREAIVYQQAWDLDTGITTTVAAPVTAVVSTIATWIIPTSWTGCLAMYWMLWFFLVSIAKLTRLQLHHWLVAAPVEKSIANSAWFRQPFNMLLFGFIPFCAQTLLDWLLWPQSRRLHPPKSVKKTSRSNSKFTWVFVWFFVFPSFITPNTNSQ